MSRLILCSAILALGFTCAPALAQDLPAPVPVPELMPEVEGPSPEDVVPEALDTEEKIEAPDYSKLSAAAERTARLDDMFTRLKAAPDAEAANLVAEEIWSIWLDSGSASINLVLRRGSDAQKKNKSKMARQMFNHVTTLEPEYAEGWARSARLALEERNLSRALVESVTALKFEPRHFYALRTMGNVFEQLNRQDDALEAYREANKLYPELKAVKDRLEALEGQVEGQVL